MQRMQKGTKYDSYCLKCSPHWLKHENLSTITSPVSTFTCI